MGQLSRCDEDLRAYHLSCALLFVRPLSCPAPVLPSRSQAHRITPLAATMARRYANASAALMLAILATASALLQLTAAFSPVTVSSRRKTTHVSAATDDEFMASLRTRVSQIEETKVPLVVLDSMVPRQVLRLQVNNPALMKLIRTQLKAENPHFGVMGKAKLSTGEQIFLKQGVEVLIRNPEFQGEGVKLELVAGRRFEVDDKTVEHTDGGWTEAKVKWLESAEQEEEEIQKAQTPQERMSVARAISKAEQFDAPSANLDGNLSLVDRWIELARENEREEGQIDELLECIGEMPPSDEPTERAFWVAALINPLPAMGVSLEIRPTLLTAKSAEARVDVALDGILRSIRHMDGTARLF